MEWIIVLVAVAGLLFWMSRTDGIGGAVARMIIRAIPRPSTQVDTRMLPRALIGGLVLGVAAGGLRLAGYTDLSFAVGLAIGPFVGGVLLRTGWWAAVAAIVGCSLVAGGEIRPFYIALPVALIAYTGVRWTPPKWLRSSGTPADPS